MQYFKLLDLDYKLAVEELRTYIFNKFKVSELCSWTPTNTTDVLNHCPNVFNMVKPLNTSITYIAFVVYHKYNQSKIHIDTDKKNSRLLLPILNCDNSETCFYSSSVPPVLAYQPNGVTFYKMNPATCKLESKFKLQNGIVLFNNTVPHNVVMSPDSIFPRISCTIALSKDLTYMLDS